jgi:hypothetical protein
MRPPSATPMARDEDSPDCSSHPLVVPAEWSSRFAEQAEAASMLKGADLRWVGLFSEEGGVQA